MKTRPIIAAILIVFVAGSLAFLLAKETKRDRSEPVSPQPVVADNPMPQERPQPVLAEGGTAPPAPDPVEQVSVAEPVEQVSVAEPDAGPSPAATDDHKVVVYYFHYTARCSRCIKFETLTDRALRSGFADKLADGSLEWIVINTDKPGNEHYLKDYNLFTKAVVVSDVRDGIQARWKNLDRIWQLYTNDQAFISYIQREVQAYMDGSGA